MIYSFRHPKRAAAKPYKFFDSPEAKVLLAQIAELKAKMVKTITVQKPQLINQQVMSDTCEGIEPYYTADKYGYAKYPRKRELNPKIEAVIQPVLLETAMIEPNFKTRETVATIARRSALNVGVPILDLSKS